MISPGLASSMGIVGLPQRIVVSQVSVPDRQQRKTLQSIVDDLFRIAKKRYTETRFSKWFDDFSSPIEIGEDIMDYAQWVICEFLRHQMLEEISHREQLLQKVLASGNSVPQGGGNAAEDLKAVRMVSKMFTTPGALEYQ